MLVSFINYLIELFDPGTIKGSILCGIATSIIISIFGIFLKIRKKDDGRKAIMKSNPENKIVAEKDEKNLIDKEVNKFDKITIKGDISGAVNFGSGKINIKK